MQESAVDTAYTSDQSDLTRGRIAPRTNPPRKVTTSRIGLDGLSTSENYTQNCTFSVHLRTCILVTVSLTSSLRMRSAVLRQLTTTVLYYGTDYPSKVPRPTGDLHPI